MNDLEAAALDVLCEAWIGRPFRLRQTKLAEALGQPVPAVREALTASSPRTRSRSSPGRPGRSLGSSARRPRQARIAVDRSGKIHHHMGADFSPERSPAFYSAPI
jgi:hypothetical protein